MADEAKKVRFVIVAEGVLYAKMRVENRRGEGTKSWC
jgi:hypothetical protein